MMVCVSLCVPSSVPMRMMTVMMMDVLFDVLISPPWRLFKIESCTQTRGIYLYCSGSCISLSNPCNLEFH